MPGWVGVRELRSGRWLAHEGPERFKCAGRRPVLRPLQARCSGSIRAPRTRLTAQLAACGHFATSKRGGNLPWSPRLGQLQLLPLDAAHVWGWHHEADGGGITEAPSITSHLILRVLASYRQGIPLTEASGMTPRYRVTLTPDERSELEAVTRDGQTKAKRFLYARALLLCDAGPEGPRWTVADTAEALGVTPRTIEHLKKRFVEEGLERALTRKQPEKPPREILFGGEFEAHLIALACSDPPEGRNRWTVRLLAEKAVELDLAPTVSHMTVQRVLKKTNFDLTAAPIGRSRRRRMQPS
jgi:hypothetical protein